MSVFKVNGIAYPTIYVTKLTRSFAVLDGDNAGRSKIGTMIRDIIGTFYNYKLELDTSEASIAEYDELYDVLSAPQDSLTLTVPYGQRTLVFEAYVTTGDDDLLDMDSNRNKWGGLSVNFIAVAPQRVPA